ncbi:MAG: S-layer homology domain-containing protein [Peptococcaceae bacterium]|jgi:hypothetical protein|nr:S-layer homology domain-containing protein [Peptococcaceae bacterium]
MIKSKKLFASLLFLMMVFSLIPISVTSGGGGLSAVLAASGNSPDYFPSLYEIGAVGIEETGGQYVSIPGIGDEYAGAIAYCPIIDLPMGGLAYEWTYNTSRPRHVEDESNNGANRPYAENEVLQASAWYAAHFVDYINNLNLLDEEGETLTAAYTSPEELYDSGYLSENPTAGEAGGSFRDAMLRLLEKGVNKAIREWNDSDSFVDGKPLSNADSVAELDTYSDWLKINGGNPASGIPSATDTAAIALEEYLALNEASLTHSPYGWPGHFSLYGSAGQEFSPFDEYFWDVFCNVAENGTVTIPGMGGSTYTVRDVGKTATGLSWKEYLATPDGQAQALQMKMSSPIPYLTTQEKIPYLQDADIYGSDEADVAPYWYVRHGMADSHAGFALGTMLYYSLLNNAAVENDLIDFNFSWRKGHGGNYDNLEAFAWLDRVLENEAAEGYTVAFDGNSGSSPAAARTGADGKLTSLPTSSRAGSRFDGWFTKAEGSEKVTLATVFTADTTVYAHWIQSGSSGSGGLASGQVTVASGGSAVPGQVTVSNSPNGTVSLSKTNPVEGDVVVVTVKPGEGYRLGAFAISDRTGIQIDHTDNGDGVYTFTYGGSPVVIDANFVPLGGASGLSGGLPFTDVRAADWFFYDVTYAYINNLMTGTAADTFSPNASLTRGMTVTILHRHAGSPVVSGADTFGDVSVGMYYTDAVNWAAANNIVSGYGNGRFGPGDDITREQLAAILARYVDFAGIILPLTRNDSSFADNADIAGYAKGAVETLFKAGIIGGKPGNLFDPKGGAMRAEAAAMLHRLLETK